MLYRKSTTKSEKPIYTKTDVSSWGKKLEWILRFTEKRTTVETKDGDVFFIFGQKNRGYVHGDHVAITPTRKWSDGKLPEARIDRLIRRSVESILVEMRFFKGKKKFWVIDEFGGMTVECDENSKISPKNGDLFLAKFLDNTKVNIISYFWNRQNQDTEETIILFRNGARILWPDNFTNLTVPEKKKYGTVDSTDFDSCWNLESRIPSEEKIQLTKWFPLCKNINTKRIDFRSWLTITIDGADAKDLDDAISVAKYENGDTLLAVHIADVAEYVEDGNMIDQEARLRGTSIYTPGKVIPMLPEILSNDRCSLHPGEPKEVLSILMRMNELGQILESQITEWLIESDHRATYDEIWEKKWNPNISENWENMLLSLWETYETLTKRRKKEGKILFETTECYFTMDAERNVIDIKKRSRNDAHMLIEECMVLANEEVAKWCVGKKLPFLSRIHSAPGDEQEKMIAEIMERKNFPLEPRHIRDHLEKAKDPSELYRLSRLLLPKMSKARYEDIPDRHFGLALQYYAHFTSPIRRYPDLLVHRIIKKYLRKELSIEEKSRYTREMKKWWRNLTECEKRAEMIERAIDSLMMCRYMKDKVGQSFPGIISGVTESNIYVELENGVEGSIFLGKNQKTLKIDPVRGSLKNTLGKEVYIIGQSVSINIKSVDMNTRRIEMNFSENLLTWY